MKAQRFFALSLLAIVAGRAGAMNCDLSAYKEQSGLSAVMKDGALEVSWLGSDSSRKPECMSPSGVALAMTLTPIFEAAAATAPATKPSSTLSMRT